MSFTTELTTQSLETVIEMSSGMTTSLVVLDDSDIDIETSLAVVVLKTDLVQEDTMLTLLNTGLMGEKGDSALVGYSFSYGDATPKLLLTIKAGQRAIEVRLDIYTAFDGVGATLSIGSVADRQELMPTDLNAPSMVATFVLSPNVLYSADTDIFLWITPGSSASTGNGEIFVSVQ